MPSYVSPKYTTHDLDLATTQANVVEIIVDRVEGWLFRPAHSLLQNPHGGFAALAIITAYFETIASWKKQKSSQYRRGFFREGLKNVFPHKFTRAEAAKIHDLLRCGLYHEGLPKRGVLISKIFTLPIAIVNGTVEINPDLLLTAIENHFKNFQNELQSKSLRQLKELIVGFQQSSPTATPSASISSSSFPAPTSSGVAP